jgi:prepilin-type N-terminal cleavage/methylation domain-containing protein
MRVSLAQLLFLDRMDFYGKAIEMKRYLKENEGFTILEVMTSMLIMSISLLLLLNLAMVALQGNTWASETTTANQLLQERLEQLRNMPNEALPTCGEDETNGVHRVWTVTTVRSHLREVTITGTWIGKEASDTHTTAMTTYIMTDSV